MDLLNAIAKSIELPPKSKSRTRDKLSDDKETHLLQFNEFPLHLDGNLYKNACSNSNPNGDLKALYNFRSLVDPLPVLGKKYLPSASSMEAIYGTIISANTKANNDFAVKMLSTANKLYTESIIYNLADIGHWRPVYAVPDDWPIADVSRYKEMSLDLTSTQTNGIVTLLKGTDKLEWKSGRQSKTINLKSQITAFNMKYLVIELRRPWYQNALFKTSGWYLSGQKAGFCSSGKLTDNRGVFPIIPTGLIISKDIQVEAEWHEEDQQLIDSHKAKGEMLSLGPLPILNSEVSNNNIVVIGWLSELIPFSPKENSPAPGTVTVYNQGASTVRFSVSWIKDDKPTTKTSQAIKRRLTKEIDIPRDATNINIKFNVLLTGGWSEIKTVNIPLPKDLSFKIIGTGVHARVTDA